MRVLVTGATGLVGHHLVEALLAHGDEVTAVSRSATRIKDIFGQRVQSLVCDLGKKGPWMDQVTGHDALVHLAGENLFARRWTDHYKKALVESRVASTSNLVAAIAAAKKKPQVFVSTSAVGYYGIDQREPSIETSKPGLDFMADLCVAWEKAAAAAAEHTRLVIVRTGIVLAADGGALSTMLPFFKKGLGGPIAGGDQWFSWIHIDDLVRIYLEALQANTLEGVVNATSVQPVTNRDFTKALAHELHRPAIFPIPLFALKMLYGDVAQVMAGGQRAIPQVLKSRAFSFRYAAINAALAAILSEK